MRLKDDLRRSEEQLGKAGTWPIRRRTAWLLAVLGSAPVVIAFALVALLP